MRYAHRTAHFDGFLARTRYELGVRRALRQAVGTLQNTARSAQAPEEAIAAVWGIRVGETRLEPLQVRSELTQFLSDVRELAPQRVLEIGTADGGMLFLLAWASGPEARVLSLDVRSYGRDREKLFGAFGRPGQRVVVRQADSQLEATRDSVSSFFGGEPLDVLFIDGDHAYEAVRRDYELYSPLVRAGGIVAFHDIVEGPETSVGGVPTFWRQIRESFDAPREIVESGTQGGYGIGVGRHRAEPGLARTP